MNGKEIKGLCKAIAEYFASVDGYTGYTDMMCREGYEEDLPIIRIVFGAEESFWYNPADEPTVWDLNAWDDDKLLLRSLTQEMNAFRSWMRYNEGDSFYYVRLAALYKVAQGLAKTIRAYLKETKAA